MPCGSFVEFSTAESQKVLFHGQKSAFFMGTGTSWIYGSLLLNEGGRKEREGEGICWTDVKLLPTGLF